MAQDTATRLRIFFKRQIDWLETRLEELDRLEALLDDEYLDALTEAEARRERELENFRREATGLLREWRASEDATETDREEIRALADQARELVNQLVKRCATAADVTRGEKARREDEFNAMRRGQGMLRKYRPGGDEDEGRIDRRA